MKARHDSGDTTPATPMQSAEETDSPAASSLNRRAFLSKASVVTAATLAAGAAGVPLLSGTESANAEAATMGSLPLQRRQDAYQLRQQAAAY